MTEKEVLTPEQWQYISVLIAADIRRDRELNLPTLVELHMPIWEKIQPYCNWDAEQ